MRLSAIDEIDSERANALRSILRNLTHPGVVIRITLSDDRVVLVSPPSRCLLSTERSGLNVEDEHVVGEHMAETMQNAALREVHFLLVSRREAEIELPDQLDGAAPDIDAVPDAGREVRM